MRAIMAGKVKPATAGFLTSVLSKPNSPFHDTSRQKALERVPETGVVTNQDTTMRKLHEITKLIYPVDCERIIANVKIHKTMH